MILFPISATLEGWLLRKSPVPDNDEGRYRSLGDDGGAGADPSNEALATAAAASASAVGLLDDNSDPRAVPLREPCDEALSVVGEVDGGSNHQRSGSPGCRRCTLFRLKQAALRVGAVACTCLVASAFEDISVFSSLVGALLVTLAGFVLPPIVHWNMRDSSTHWTSMVLDVVLILFGLTACAMGTTSAVQDLINATAA